MANPPNTLARSILATKNTIMLSGNRIGMYLSPAFSEPSWTKPMIMLPKIDVMIIESAEYIVKNPGVISVVLNFRIGIAIDVVDSSCIPPELLNFVMVSTRKVDTEYRSGPPIATAKKMKMPYIIT